MLTTREPSAASTPFFFIARAPEASAWAVRHDVPDNVAAQLAALAAKADLDGVAELVGGRIESGPAFAFPDHISAPDSVVLLEDARAAPWLEGEFDGRAPVVAVLEGGNAVSVCHCARRSDVAAEAGLFTVDRYRGRGFGPQVTAAWALAIRASGRVPLYSTSWTNDASRRVAEKLGLIQYACDWSVSDH